VVNLIVLDRSLGRRAKQGSRQLFREKVHPRQNPGYSYAPNSVFSTSTKRNFFSGNKRQICA